jgi:hypothetical protein
MESAEILCQTGCMQAGPPPAPVTFSGRDIRLLDVLDTICASNGLYWEATGERELSIWPDDALSRGKVRVLPGDANWTNAPCYLFSRELVRRGEPPAARNKTVRVMEHEALPDVQFRDTDFKDAATWLCGQRDVPLLFLAKGGASRHPVSFDMTNAPLFTVLDEICRQSHQYWGFFNGKLAVLSSEEFITDDAWLLPDSFVLTGRERGPAYRRRLPPGDENPVMQEKLLFIVNEPVFPTVSFTDTPVLDALYWLAKQARQSYSASLGRGGDSSGAALVTLSMTNAPFLSAVDEICRQADWRWGFRGRIFMLFPESVLTEEYKWTLQSIVLPPASFRDQSRGDIFNAIRTSALAEIGKRNGNAVGVIMDPPDAAAAERRKYTFDLGPLSVYDSFMRAGALMDVPVAFTNGIFFVGAGAANEAQERRTSKDEPANPSR